MITEKALKKLLDDQRKAIHSEMDAMIEKAIAEDYSDEREAEETQKIYQKYQSENTAIWLDAVRRSSQPRNEWFKNFCKSFKEGKTNISEKQFLMFVKYGNFSREHYFSYCAIVDGYEYAATEHGKHREVTVKKLPSIKI